MASLRDLSLYLRGISHALATNVERADKVMKNVNDDLARMHDSGLLVSTVIFGPMVLARVYAVGVNRTDSAQVIQAVLTIPGGIGAVHWDTEDWFMLDYDPKRETKALRGAVPYEECEAAIRGLLAPHAASMIEELMNTFSL